jgi:ABC-2 type transport system permease protein
MNGLNIPVTLRVARKDLRILLKEQGTLLMLFVIPIVFILAFSVGAGVNDTPQEEAISLPVVNLDAGSPASETLLEALDQGGGIQCEFYDQAQAQTLLDKEKINRILTIPANYSADLQDGRQVTLQLVNSPTANPSKTEAVYRVVTGVAADLSMETQLIASFKQMGDMQAATSPDEQVFTSNMIIEQAQSQFARARTEPLLAVEERWPEALLEDEQEFNPLSVYIPGFAVLFIFLTAQTTAQSIYEEKKTGSFRRLLAAPISRPTVLVGKMTPNFITGVVQIIVLFGAGVIVLPLLGFGRMSLGNDPLALVLVCLVVLLCSTSLGGLIAAIARTEGQISGLSSVVLWGFGFAGIWLNQMSAPEFFEPISKVIPHYWANLAFLDLFIRGKSLEDILPSILALLGFTAVFFAIGLWQFDFVKLNEAGD